MGSQQIVRPPKLGKGSRIALVAPAGPLLERDDLTRAQALCRALDYDPVLGRNAYARHGYLAGTDEERLSDFNRAASDPSIDAIWCIRGGYGSIRLLDRIDYDALVARPRVVIGFSDITAVLNAITHLTGLITFHGPVARSSMSEFTRQHFERILSRPDGAGRLDRIPAASGALIPRENRIVALTGGVAEGRLIGGNLTLLQCLIGTPYFPDLAGAILFVEDVGEDLYRIDRMLAHLRLCGALRPLAGVLIGRFTDLERSGADGARGFDEVLSDYLAPLRIPVAYGFPVGHIDDQWTLPLGVRARLDADAGELDILESAVA
jgi:muramoyltetrapeptide carboxypeptidase